MSNVNEVDETQAVASEDFLDPMSWTGATEPIDIGEDLIGVTLNDTYVPERILGEGGMGRVYLARHTRILQKRVAVKVLHPEYFGNAQVLARFQREAETAAAISHPNVVTVLDVDRTPHGLPYLVTEYLDGIDLSEQLKSKGKLSAGSAVHIARQLCKGLGAAHQSQVIHRDVKPQNIFLVGDFSHGLPERPAIKVLDFGLSRFSDSSDNLTQTGCIMGTPAYMAPEQALGQQVDHRTDIYGVGVVLYTMLTGRPPFEADSPQATVLAVMNSEPPRPRSVEPTILPRLELIIERAMARNPAERYQDMAAFEQALTGFESESLARPIESIAPLVPKQDPNARRTLREAEADADVHSARPRLVLFALAAALLMISCAISSISGVEHATHYRFSRMELELLSLGIVGSALTPALLWVLHVRRRVWENSSRVLALLGQVRAAVIAGISMYGLGLLSLHVIDDFAVRLVGTSGLPALGASWPGWSLLLPIMALNASITALWLRRLSAIRSGWRRRLAASLVTSLGLVIFGALVMGGLWWRQRLG